MENTRMRGACQEDEGETKLNNCPVVSEHSCIARSDKNIISQMSHVRVSHELFEVFENPPYASCAAECSTRSLEPHFLLADSSKSLKVLCYKEWHERKGAEKRNLRVLLSQRGHMSSCWYAAPQLRSFLRKVQLSSCD
jgi:hypothetical protein